MNIVYDILRAVFTDANVLQILGFVVSTLLIWLLTQASKWMGLKLRADRAAMLSLAIDKAMTFAVVKAEDVIKENGWDSPHSRIEVINRAVPVLKEKFSDTLRHNGIDLNDEDQRAQIREQMERMLPDVFSRVAASPATPPAPIVPVAVVPAPSSP